MNQDQTTNFGKIIKEIPMAERPVFISNITCIPETPNYDLKKKLKPLILIGFKHSRHYINLVMCYTIHN